MSDTIDLITFLSADAKTTKKAVKPSYWSFRILLIIFIYAVACHLFLGIRTDLLVQFTRPYFVVEVVLLAFLLITSIIAAVLSMYPDSYQKPSFLKLPYIFFILLLVAVGIQILMPHDILMVVPEVNKHGMECALCIASFSLVPSALIFSILRKGASVHQFQAGSFAVLAAASIGCLILRLAEANDSIIHLVQWHYVPILLFSALGAFLGKWLLKW